VSPGEVSAIIFVCIFSSAMVGMWLRGVLPQHHLNDETKDLVKLGVGLVGTMAALLLGLLVASAKSSFDTRSSEVTQMAADAVLLDRVLAHYGPATDQIRGILKIAITRIIDQVWSHDGKEDTLPSQAAGNVVYDKIQELVPTSDGQRMLQSQAESTLVSFGQARLLLFAQSGSAIATPFLVVVVFWLGVLFVSFGLFAPRNGTAIATLFIAAISVAGALYLILELGHPFSGWIQISSAPLRNALAVLGK
jgi:Protein of unknown function (DUF4239)